MSDTTPNGYEISSAAVGSNFAYEGIVSKNGRVVARTEWVYPTTHNARDAARQLARTL